MKLGIIAGSGQLPIQVASACDDASSIFIAQISGDELLEEYKPYTNVKPFFIGEVQGITDYFKAGGVTHIVLAGAVTRPNFLSLKVDMLGASLIFRIIKNSILGDDKLLRIVASFIEEQGFKVISATEVVKNATLPLGVATTIAPDAIALRDIEIGKEEAKRLGFADLGQAVIVEGGVVLGLEEVDGTDALIKRCSAIKKHKKAGVLVKVMKPIQDTRLDIPVIGVDTVKSIAKSGLVGIAIEADKVIVIGMESTLQLANELGVFIVGV